MRSALQTESTLTDRYQTTIPERIRATLHLSKRDKITYTVEDNGTVLISRAEEEDPALGKFLSFLAHDIQTNPKNIHPLDAKLIERALSLVAGVNVDLDKPLSDKDE